MSLTPKQVDFDSTWLKLQNTVRDVLIMESVRHKVWTNCFSDVYSLCVAHPESLADRLYEEIKALFVGHINKLQTEVTNSSDILNVYHHHWIDFSKGAKYLDSLFSYLNQQHIQKQKYSEADQKYGQISVDFNEQHLEIGELAFEIWKKELIENVKDDLIRVLIECIKNDRDGKSTSAPVNIIKGVINSFVEVCVFQKKDIYMLYEDIFEKALLTETSDYYKLESSNFLSSLSLSEYMEKLLQRKDEETLRCTKFLPPMCHEKIEKKVHYELVESHLSTLQAEAQRLVTEERSRDLSNMYKLLKPIHNGLKPLICCMQEHIKKQGIASVQSLTGENLPTLFVENLLAVHVKYSEFVADLFNQDRQFEEALQRAFEAAVNNKLAKKAPKSPEIIAKYCDTLLKKSTKGLSDSEVDDKLSACITIFKYIEDKDVFQKFYSRHLAKRLIHGQSLSMEAEELMINKLKTACGYEFTSKLHRMFTDMAVSSVHNKVFAEYCKMNNHTIDFNLSFNILQAGAWPLTSSSSSPMTLPVQLEKPLQYFDAFYQQSYNGRKLSWLHQLSYGELKCSFTDRIYIITMFSCQIIILLSFQQVNSMKMSELSESTKLNSEGNKYLQSLIDAKILSVSDESLSPDAEITLNTAYHNRRTKFRINVSTPKEVEKQEVAQTHNSLEEDRKMYLQAAIVRIMKARKMIRHTDLVQEVIDIAKGRFAPKIPMIKKCLELLLDKQYIERSSEKHDTYQYVA